MPCRGLCAKSDTRSSSIIHPMATTSSRARSGGRRESSSSAYGSLDDEDLVQARPVAREVLGRLVEAVLRRPQVAVQVGQSRQAGVGDEPGPD